MLSLTADYHVCTPDLGHRFSPTVTSSLQFPLYIPPSQPFRPAFLSLWAFLEAILGAFSTLTNLRPPSSAFSRVQSTTSLPCFFNFLSRASSCSFSKKGCSTQLLIMSTAIQRALMVGVMAIMVISRSSGMAKTLAAAAAAARCLLWWKSLT